MLGSLEKGFDMVSVTNCWLALYLKQKKCLDEKCPDFLIMWSTDIVNILDFNDDRSTVVIMT